jgi:hypothetical protein
VPLGKNIRVISKKKEESKLHPGINNFLMKLIFQNYQKHQNKIIINIKMKNNIILNLYKNKRRNLKMKNIINLNLYKNKRRNLLIKIVGYLTLIKNRKQFSTRENNININIYARNVMVLLEIKKNFKNIKNIIKNIKIKSKL